MNLPPPVYQFLSAATGGAKGRTARHLCLTRDSNPGPLVQQPASLTASPLVGKWAQINKLFSEIKTKREYYLIEGAILFLIEMTLKAGDVEPTVLGTQKQCRVLINNIV